MRDMRDPQALGEFLTVIRNTPSARAGSIREAYDIHDPLFWLHGAGRPENYAKNEGPVEKYGRAGEVEPLFMEVQVR